MQHQLRPKRKLKPKKSQANKKAITIDVVMMQKNF